jgi:predicted RNA-binding Zn-ribbon protein involved in translation (DUF1610 family)
MKYRLWLENLDCGVAADQYALDWRDNMREHGYDDVLLGLLSDDIPVTFPIPDDEDEEPEISLDAITFERCPHCHEVISLPGFNTMLAFICPKCGNSVAVERPLQ